MGGQIGAGGGGARSATVAQAIAYPSSANTEYGQAIYPEQVSVSPLLFLGLIQRTTSLQKFPLQNAAQPTLTLLHWSGDICVRSGCHQKTGSTLTYEINAMPCSFSRY